ncbi:MAG: RraA family protein [Thermomicrobiales bacterium]
MALDNALFEMMADKLYVAVISDILDGLGLRQQVLQPGIVPVQPNALRPLVGRAATALIGPQYEVVGQPYTNQIAVIDALQPGDVVVSGTGGLNDVAVWGELFSNAAMARGARGLLTDGRHRDTRMILELGFPIYSRGARPVDSSGRCKVIEYGRPVAVAGVVVRPGDIVFAEIDGIAIVPQEVAEEVVERAFAKVAKEDGARADLRAGLLLSEVWTKYRVL